MGHDSCCVVNCKNTGRNNKKVKYYLFPTASHKINQKKKWIAAVKKANFSSNGSVWKPKGRDVICSEHFVNNEKADSDLSPSYVPTIFPSINKSKMVNAVNAADRHKRFIKRIIMKSNLEKKKSSKKIMIPDDQLSNSMMVDKTLESPKSFHDQSSHNLNNSDDDLNSNITEETVENNLCHDQECEVFFYIESNEASKTFVCNRYIFRDKSTVTCEVEVQTDIIEISAPCKITNRKQYKNVESNTDCKTFVDKIVGPDSERKEQKYKGFSGFESVKKDEQLIDLAGVTFDNFRFLLKRLNINLTDNCQVSLENRLFIFLTKMKTGMTFSALSVIFDIHRTTVSRIFYSSLRHLARATADYVYWPEKADVLSTMPECFRENYNNTRVIIDCTEFRVESPPRVDDRVYVYSNYKKGFTAKLLVGMTPSGFISFKSKVAGGRKSDSQITIESGLINLLEDDDAVLADKGFPQFQNIIDESGVKVLLIMPPFLEKNEAFTEEETRETYKVAKCRIHVERIMQRIRTYLILNKITHNLYKYIDEIVHVICVLVNLQPPIIKIVP